MARDWNVQDVSILVDRSSEIAALAANRDEDLIQMQDVTKPALVIAQCTCEAGPNCTHHLRMAL